MFSLLYDFVHVRLLDFSSVHFLHFCASRLEFRMYLCAHAFYIRTQARSMCTHTTDLCTLAYVCAHIVVPRNPNLGFLFLVLCFFHIIFPFFVHFYAFYFSVSLFNCLFAFNMLN